MWDDEISIIFIVPRPSRIGGQRMKGMKLVPRLVTNSKIISNNASLLIILSQDGRRTTRAGRRTWRRS